MIRLWGRSFSEISCCEWRAFRSFEDSPIGPGVCSVRPASGRCYPKGRRRPKRRRGVSEMGQFANVGPRVVKRAVDLMWHRFDQSGRVRWQTVAEAGPKLLDVGPRVDRPGKLQSAPNAVDPGPKLAECGRSRPEFERFRPRVGPKRPNRAGSGQIRPTSVERLPRPGHHLPHSGPKFARIRHGSAQIQPSVARIGPNSRDFGECGPETRGRRTPSQESVLGGRTNSSWPARPINRFPQQRPREAIGGDANRTGTPPRLPSGRMPLWANLYTTQANYNPKSTARMRLSRKMADRTIARVCR